MQSSRSSSASPTKAKDQGSARKLLDLLLASILVISIGVKVKTPALCKCSCAYSCLWRFCRDGGEGFAC